MDVSIAQAVIESTRTLQDISDDRVVPLDFLAALLVLFCFMVLDRLFYTLGLHLGKASPFDMLWLPNISPSSEDPSLELYSR